MMHIPLGEYQNPGVLQAPMAVKDQWVMPNICYEDLFGEEIAQQLRAQSAFVLRSQDEVDARELPVGLRQLLRERDVDDDQVGEGRGSKLVLAVEQRREFERGT